MAYQRFFLYHDRVLLLVGRNLIPYSGKINKKKKNGMLKLKTIYTPFSMLFNCTAPQNGTLLFITETLLLEN